MRDLREYLDEALELPIGGTTYRVVPPTAAAGLRLERLAFLSDRLIAGDELTAEELREMQLTDDQEINFYADNLGEAYGEMLAGGVRFNELKVAASTAFLAWTKGHEAAEMYWSGKAQATPKGPARRRSTSKTTAAASTTKRPASGTGTTPRRKSSKRQPAASPRKS